MPIALQTLELQPKVKYQSNQNRRSLSRNNRDPNTSRKNIYKNFIRDLNRLVYWICVGTLSFQLWMCIDKYSSSPSYYETKNLKQRSAKFPDITLCSNKYPPWDGATLQVLSLKHKICCSKV